MSERLRDVLTVTLIVAVLLLALWGVLALRRGRAAEPAPQAGRGAGVEPGRRAAVPAAAKTAAAPVPSVAGEASTSRPLPPADPGPGAKASAAVARWTKRPPADFTPEDLLQCGRGVRVDLGTYEAAVGSEFEVALQLVSPALESCTLVVQYERGALAVVPESARPEGAAFRGGIEAYDAPGGGKLMIIHAGTPGRKNVDAAVSGSVVVWRMRALRPGVTRLSLLPESSFTSGRGDDESYDVAGGEVSIR